jgi:hypothetical protein
LLLTNDFLSQFQYLSCKHVVTKRKGATPRALLAARRYQLKAFFRVFRVFREKQTS